MRNLIFVIACFTLVACGSDKDPVQPVPNSPVDIQKVDNSEEITQKLASNEFCTQSRKGEATSKVLFEFEFFQESQDSWFQWVKAVSPEGKEEVAGSWSVKDSVLTIQENSDRSISYEVTFTEDGDYGVTTGVVLTPLEADQATHVYSVCDAEAKIAREKAINEWP